MDLLMDGLLIAATLFAGGYCWVLARRVRDLKSLDKGLGGSIVTLTRQIELARATLDEARGAAKRQQARARPAHRPRRDRRGASCGCCSPRSARARAGARAAPRRAARGRGRARAARRRRRPGAAAAGPAPPAAAARAIAATLAAAPPARRRPPRRRPRRPEVPKPRALPPLESPLRKRGQGRSPAGSEDDLIEALSALAAGGER